ncbi:MAG: histidinol-phosphatase [Bacteroidales bacterium]|nr:histidinol-phosphatase [Bacteroidales bacterium]
MLANLHTHTRFSDGSGEPVQYVEEALNQGLSSLGFSDHSPLPFENSFALRENQVEKYCSSICSLKNQFAPSKALDPRAEPANLDTSGIRHPTPNIHIFLGLEVDFIPEMGHPFSNFRENFPMDFLIGSVHLVRNGSLSDLWFIDGPDPATYDEGLNKLFDGDIRKGVTTYYQQINEMLTTNTMDIIGHLDKIKMHNRNRFFSEDEPWYQKLVDETLDLVKKSGVIVEVNTRGIYKKRTDSVFPGTAVLKKIKKLDIPIILSSDAHKPQELTLMFPETKKLLAGLGFCEIMDLTSEGWKSVPLDN